MGEFFKTLTGTKQIQALVFGWYVPVFTAALVFVVQIYPAVADTAAIDRLRVNAHHVGLDGTTFFLIATVLASILGSVSSRTLYGLLEGYIWPPWLTARRRMVHQKQYAVLSAEREQRRAEQRRDRVREELDRLRIGASHDSTQAHRSEFARAQEQFAEAEAAARTAEDAATAARDTRGASVLNVVLRGPLGRFRRSRPLFVNTSFADYPQNPCRILSTRFGNRMRSFESYGSSIFGLDSQTLWYELVSVLPDQTRDGLSDVQVAADFNLCSLTAAVVLGLTGMTVGVTEHDAVAFVTGLLSIAISPLLHRRLLAAAYEWRYAMQGAVNIGRVQLAKELGLELPVTLDGERHMWDAVTNGAFYQSRDWWHRLDGCRAGRSDADETPRRPLTRRSAGRRHRR